MDSQGDIIYREFRAGKDTADITSRARDLGLGRIDEAEVDRILWLELERRRGRAA